MLFLSCRHFVGNTTFSTSLVDNEVISVSWLGHLYSCRINLHAPVYPSTWPKYHFTSNTFAFVFVLMGWSLLPNVLRPLQICCAPPKVGIRTWIWRLNFAQRHIFQALTSLKSQTWDHQLKVPPGGLGLRIFTSWKKNPWT